MSSRWPQEQQHQRSPYATYDESSPREGEGVQPWQDSGWQDPDGQGYGEDWASAQGVAQPRGAGVVQAVAEPRAPGRQDQVSNPVAQQRRNPPADDYQREGARSAGGFREAADYEGFDYLSGGHSAEAKPAVVPG